jgi:hypothetical protein
MCERVLALCTRDGIRTSVKKLDCATCAARELFDQLVAWCSAGHPEDGALRQTGPVTTQIAPRTRRDAGRNDSWRRRVCLWLHATWPPGVPDSGRFGSGACDGTADL